MARRDEVWKSATLAQTFLEGVRGGIPFAAEQIDMMMRVIVAREVTVERFADLGCGDGILARAILSRYPQAVGTLLDFSEPMLRQAQARLSQYSSNLRFVLADFGVPAWVHAVADHTPFDAIVSGYAIHHQRDERKQQLYREILDLLKPGGVFVNVEHVSSPTKWIESVSDGLMIDSLCAFHTQKGTGQSREHIAEEFVRRPDKAANILAPVEVQCEWLRANGFEDVDCYFKAFELAVFGGRRQINGRTP